MKNIKIKNIATFDEEGIVLEPNKINFIFGSNGSGKTTISNVIADISKHPNCNIEWQNNISLSLLVYNRRFVHQNFGQSPEIAGIFTLGEENINAVKNIEEKQQELELKVNCLNKNQIDIKDKNNLLAKLIDVFKEECWEVYKSYQTAFGGAFEGYKTKQKFADKIISLCQKNRQNNSSNIATYLELEKKSQAIFDKQATKIGEIAELTLPNLGDTESNPVLGEIIIGKNEIDIAKMILKLNNSDWVKKGANYLKEDSPDCPQMCPFCQQEITDNFKKQLDEYFDENYLQKIRALEIVRDKYSSALQPLLSSISQYKFANNSFINLDSLIDLKNIIKAKFEKNLLEIDRKIKEPSLKIELESIEFEAKRVQKIIAKAALETREHNQLINNLDREKDLLKSQIWAFVADDLTGNYKKYDAQKGNLDKEIEALKSNNSQTEQEIRLLKQKIIELESKVTSIKPVITSINQTLSSIGFTNFSLAEIPNQAKYRIIRPNGSDARLTLSEGEKTFITFLYFYHLTKGGFAKDQTTENRVIILDDPISSLDGNVLGIVSELVRELIASCVGEKSNIRQMIILTHNNDFYHKITFKKDDQNSSFFMLNKLDGKSQIKFYKNNPIQQ